MIIPSKLFAAIKVVNVPQSLKKIDSIIDQIRLSVAKGELWAGLLGRSPSPGEVKNAMGFSGLNTEFECSLNPKEHDPNDCLMFEVRKETRFDYQI